MRRFENVAVARVFEAYPPAMRRKLMSLRKLIFETAASTEGVGEIDETLKWGEPANQDLLRRASDLPALSEGWRDHFRKRLAEPDG